MPPGCLSMTDKWALWQRSFPGLAAAPDARRLAADAHLVTLRAGQTVFRTGSACDDYLLVVDGCVKVLLTTESGREVVLYRVRSGESCILTTSCLIAGQHYPAQGITEDEVTAFALGRERFQRQIDHSSAFRAFVFDNFSRRLAEVIARMEQVAFGAVDARLARVLLARGSPVTATHEALAAELGTAREVVSRHLKRFEAEGWVRLGRGSIEVLQPAVLARL